MDIIQQDNPERIPKITTSERCMTITIIYKGDGKYDPTFDTYTAERTYRFRKVKELTMSNNIITIRFNNENEDTFIGDSILTENLDIVESFVIK